MTQLTRGGGIGIKVPIKFKQNVRNDLNSVNRSFFESLFVEIQAPFKKYFPKNISYCANKNLSELFLDELTSENTSAYSMTDNVVLLGDYNIRICQSKRKTVIDRFSFQ